MTPANKKTVLFGASDNPERYSNRAVRKLRAQGHDVVAIGKRQSVIDGVRVQQEMVPVQNVDTVTLYLNPGNQKMYYDYILSLHPKRIIFNPGAENPELEKLAVADHIQTQQACTLVLLATGQY